MASRNGVSSRSRLAPREGLIKHEETPVTEDLSGLNAVRVAIVSDTHGHLCSDVQAIVEGCHVAVHYRRSRAEASHLVSTLCEQGVHAVAVGGALIAPLTPSA